MIIIIISAYILTIAFSQNHFKVVGFLPEIFPVRIES